MMRDWFASRRRELAKPHWSVRLGVRGLVFDSAGRIFVVRHSNVPGCHLPGGSVESGESAMAAFARALEMKCDIFLARPPVLHGLFFNDRTGEHIVCYVVHDYNGRAPRAPNWGMDKAGFFPLDQLPEAPSPATRARLDEVLGGASISHIWQGQPSEIGFHFG